MDDQENGDDRRGIQSIDFVGKVLRALAAAPGPLNLKTLSIDTGVPAAKLHRYLTSLIRIGLASQHEKDGKYDLGPLAIRLGLAAMARRSVIDEAEKVLNDLLDRHGLTGHLSVWGEQGPVIVRTHHGGVPLVTSLGLGRVLPITRSATGLVFMAFLPEVATAPIARREANAATDKDLLNRKVEDTRIRGVGFVDGTVIPGLAALSVPVFDFDGSLACALTATALDGAFGKDGADSAIAHELAAAANSIKG
ncbi:IclR family transcriptional regulator [Mesorhizobium sp. UC22_110]|uniref:IclR family transcriptional regulator n=1 Tax=unclassified Mesorhizobium TaxID=325217 RepID=UPI00366F8252